jgi:hypothetical protein
MLLNFFYSGKIAEIQDVNCANYSKLVNYNANQKESIDRVIVCTNNNILDVILEFESLSERLVALKAFLHERGAIEETYAQKLDAFSKKWIHEGDVKRFATAPSGSGAAGTGTGGSNNPLLSDPNADIFGPEGAAAALWKSTTTALQTTGHTVANNAAATAATFAATAASAATTVRRLSLAEGDASSFFSSSSSSSSGGGGAAGAAAGGAELKQVSTAVHPGGSDGGDNSNDNDSDSDVSASPNPRYMGIGSTVKLANGGVSSAAKRRPSRSVVDDYYFNVCSANQTMASKFMGYSQRVGHYLPKRT